MRNLREWGLFFLYTPGIVYRCARYFNKARYAGGDVVNMLESVFNKYPRNAAAPFTAGTDAHHFLVLISFDLV